jgi:hypothetical protein
VGKSLWQRLLFDFSFCNIVKALMNKPEFNNLSLKEQIHIACDGHYVDVVKHDDFIVQLYSLSDGSFCEVFYTPQTSEIQRVAICEDADLKKFFPVNLLESFLIM